MVKPLICSSLWCFNCTQDARGPKGVLKGEPADLESPSRWFAVYRPCSSDSIRKMYGKVGVGKGLNVKGKPLGLEV